MKKTGFTLIELLAVIVVLGLITVIIAPKVAETIRESEEQTKIASANEFIKLIETETIKSEYRKTNKLTSGTWYVDKDGNLCDSALSNNNSCPSNATKYELKYSGDQPLAGSRIVIEDSKVVAGSGSNMTLLKMSEDFQNIGISNDGEVVDFDTYPELIPTSKVVYSWHTTKKHVGDTLDASEYVENYTQLNYEFYFKHELDQDDKIEKTYLCTKKNNSPVCVETGEGAIYGWASEESNYTGNLAILRDNLDDCDFYENRTLCDVIFYVYPNGTAKADPGYAYCKVDNNYDSWCEDYR